jgi:hypothetical protein
LHIFNVAVIDFTPQKAKLDLKSMFWLSNLRHSKISEGDGRARIFGTGSWQDDQAWNQYTQGSNLMVQR